MDGGKGERTCCCDKLEVVRYRGVVDEGVGDHDGGLRACVRVSGVSEVGRVRCVFEVRLPTREMSCVDR